MSVLLPLLAPAVLLQLTTACVPTVQLLPMVRALATLSVTVQATVLQAMALVRAVQATVLLPMALVLVVQATVLQRTALVLAVLLLHPTALPMVLMPLTAQVLVTLLLIARAQMALARVMQAVPRLGLDLRWVDLDLRWLAGVA